MASPDYVALSTHLPAVYQEDLDSFTQLDSYLGLADDLHRAYVERIEELTTWLSPDALTLWPPASAVGAGDDEILARYLAVYDELGRWFSFRFPVSWGTDAASLLRRRDFVSTAARLWRRRGTPRGFVRWFCFYFGVEEDDRPWLIEHFKFGQPTAPDGELGPEPWLRATLFVPSTDQFENYSRRREAVSFVARYAPAHVHMRVCFVAPDFTLEPVPGIGASASDIATYRDRVNELLCTVVTFTDHGNAIHLWECIDEGRPVDRLGVGRLPSDSDIVSE